MAWNELVSVSTQIHIATSRRRNKHAQKHCQWQCTPATPHSYFDAMAQQSSAQQAAKLKAMDANNDGKVTLAEQQAFLQQQMSQGSDKAP